MEYTWKFYRDKDEAIKRRIGTLKKYNPSLTKTDKFDIGTLDDLYDINPMFHKLYLRAKTIVNKKLMEKDTEWPNILTNTRYRMWHYSSEFISINAPVILLSSGGAGYFLIWEDEKSKFVHLQEELKDFILVDVLNEYTTTVVKKDENPSDIFKGCPEHIVNKLLYYKLTGYYNSEGEIEKIPKKVLQLHNNHIKIVNNYYSDKERKKFELILKHNSYGNRLLPKGLLIFCRNKYMCFYFKCDCANSLRSFLSNFSVVNGKDNCIIVGKELGKKICNGVIGFIETVRRGIRPEESEIEAIKLLNQYGRKIKFKQSSKMYKLFNNMF